ncbi:MAG: hypothetical protein EOO56_25185 [Hymenobacter sp.]|nr:MAG: hypothetical protein EOO56_25185 [Hymenobacter sp.]
MPFLKVTAPPGTTWPMLHAYLTDFVALFFPRACLACQAALLAGEQHLCTACRIELPYTHYHLLPAAQNPLGRRFWGKLPVLHEA